MSYRTHLERAAVALIFGAVFMSTSADAQIARDFNALKATEGTAQTPRISTAALLSAPENLALYNLVTRAPADAREFAGKRIAVISADGVEEIELTATLQYFRARGATVHLIAPPRPSYPSHFGVQVPEIRETHILTIRYMENGGWIKFDRKLTEARPQDYDAVIIPGGAWNPDTLRADAAALDFVRAVSAAGKPVAAICHGPWVLGDAGLLKGRRATSWWSMQRDIVGAGGVFVDQAVVVDGNLITSRAPIDLPEFLNAIGAALD
jgi:protease I